MSLGPIPSTLDRADGSVDGYGAYKGIATPAEARIVSPSPTFFYEMPNSPSIEKSEQATIAHKFVMDWGTGKTLLSAISRGSILTDSFGNVSRVLSNRIDYLKGDYCQQSVTAEGVSFNIPPDEFDIEVLEFNPALQKHPRYAGLNQAGTSPGGTKYAAWQLVAIILQAVQQQMANAGPLMITTGSNSFDNLTGGTGLSTDPILNQAGHELYNKLLKGIDTFYLAGLRVRYSTFNFYPQNIDFGGRIEDPVNGGGLPYYFWSNDGTGSPKSNIFTALASLLSPQFYGNGISWLREADSQGYQRTWFRKTSSWIGGPAGGPFGNGFTFTGHWDTDVYATAFTSYNLLA